MTGDASTNTDALDRAVRLQVFGQAAATARVPQAAEIAEALGRTGAEVEASLLRLAAGRVLILAPNGTTIWAPNPFCAVPSDTRVEARGRTYWAICIWDALGIPAALHADATVRAGCGDCGDELVLEVRDGRLARAEGVVHFGVPAMRWWENIGHT
jgi:hypothetical protein